ncbi:hypothetical protein ACFPRL_31210 [Pseudoclavibacter helvolus]
MGCLSARSWSAPECPRACSAAASPPQTVPDSGVPGSGVPGSGSDQRMRTILPSVSRRTALRDESVVSGGKGSPLKNARCSPGVTPDSRT